MKTNIYPQEAGLAADNETLVWREVYLTKKKKDLLSKIYNIPWCFVFKVQNVWRQCRPTERDYNLKDDVSGRKTKVLQPHSTNHKPAEHLTLYYYFQIRWKVSIRQSIRSTWLYSVGIHFGDTVTQGSVKPATSVLLWAANTDLHPLFPAPLV